MRDPATTSDAKNGRPSARARHRGRLLVAIVALYVLSVPWYRDSDAPLRLWLGLPDWVAVALLCYVGAAILNALAWWSTDIDDDAPSVVRDWAPTDESPTPDSGSSE